MYGNKLEISDSEILEMLHKFDTFKEESGYDINRAIDNNSLSSGQMQKVAFIFRLRRKVPIIKGVMKRSASLGGVQVSTCTARPQILW